MISNHNLYSCSQRKGRSGDDFSFIKDIKQKNSYWKKLQTTNKSVDKKKTGDIIPNCKLALSNFIKKINQN